MNRNSRKAAGRNSVRRVDPHAAKRVQNHRRKRRKRRQNSLLPALLFTLGMLALIALAVRLLSRPAANVPAASEVQTSSSPGPSPRATSWSR